MTSFTQTIKERKYLQNAKKLSHLEHRKDLEIIEKYYLCSPEHNVQAQWWVQPRCGDVFPDKCITNQSWNHDSVRHWSRCCRYGIILATQSFRKEGKESEVWAFHNMHTHWSAKLDYNKMENKLSESR